MSMVKVELGLSVAVPGADSWVKPTIGLEVDTGGNIPAQVAEQLDVAASVMSSLDERYEEILTDLLASSTGEESLRRTLAEMRHKVDQTIEKVRELNTIVRELAPDDDGKLYDAPIEGAASD